MRALQTGGSVYLVVIFAFVTLGSAAHAALVISGEATKNISCAAGTCIATANRAVMNAGDLTAMLAASDVTLASGGLAQDVKIKIAFSWTSASRLTLDSHRAIVIAEPLTAAGPGALTLTTNDGGHGGALTFPGNGRAIFWDLSSSLVIDGASYTLVGDIATLASGIAGNSAGRFALANNYDAGQDGTYTDSPVPSFFSGRFEGLGNVIANLTIRAIAPSRRLGLFAYVAVGGSVGNFGLASELIDGTRLTTAGGLAAQNDGTVSNAFVRGIISVDKRGVAGGLIGVNGGHLIAVRSSGKVKARSGGIAGGLVGFQSGNARGDLGATVGAHSTAHVIAGSDSYAGGLMGLAIGTIRQSWAGGAVTVGDDDGHDTPPTGAGGLIGYFFATQNVPGTMADNYATGAVHGGIGSNVGGLIGVTYAESNSDGPILTSYATGAVANAGSGFAGGFIGFEAAQANSDAYWDTDTSGISDPSRGAGNFANDPGITGLTDAQLKSGLPAGFDPAIWAENPAINGGLPYLIANPPP